jgi:manganese transport protein
MSEQRETTGKSLREVHRTVSIPQNAGLFRRLIAFAGPAYLVSVGYMDPGNWATDLEGGARFNNELLWVLLMSNLMAIILQTLAARLGIVTGKDLAQACRDYYPRTIAFLLWIMGEVAIAACDLAEVLGTAIGINLLFGIPLIFGVIITAADTLLFLIIQQYGIRKMEAFILMLITTIGISFAIELFLSSPDWGTVAGGMIPRLSHESLYVGIGILGATVMPHNLYLHSALVQTRRVEQTLQGKHQACRWNFIDTAIALNGAFFVNAAILIVSASVFFRNGIVVTEIQQAHQLLSPLLGTALASTLFAISLIAAGQSSTLTGTLAGQIVMEGFMKIKVRPAVRRLITRLAAIVPATLVIAVRGEQESFSLLILSQVILSLQLPFAVIPLIKFTSDETIMGEFSSRTWLKVLAWAVALVIVALNAQLIFSTIAGWMTSAGGALWLWLAVVPVTVGCALLLVYISLPRAWRLRKRAAAPPVEKVVITPEKYSTIGVALDYGPLDSKVLSHAQTLARYHGAAVVLFHVVEGVSGQLYGKEADDDEARSDLKRLEYTGGQLANTGLEVRWMLGFGSVPDELVRLVREQGVDLLVMGGHRHRGLKDIFFGASISRVRHQLAIPVLIVQ